MRVCLFAFSAALLVSVSSARAGDIDWFTGVWHNDLFAGSDGGGYTNGLYLSWFDLSDTHPDHYGTPWLTRPFESWLMPEAEGNLEVSAYTLGQAMMTPKDIEKVVPDEDDAPYAGLLQLRSAYTVVGKDVADTLSVTVGIVGPSSGAEEVQRAVHRMVGATEPRGWDYQIKDEPVGQIERIRVWRFGPAPTEEPHLDLLLIGSGSLGNLESSAGSAMLVRFGTRLDRSFGTASQLVGRVSNPMAIDGGWNVYLGASATYVYNQIFISGGGLRSGQSADLRHDQYATYAGFSYSWSRLSVSFSFVANTNLDKNASARQKFGTLQLGWKF
ncbi:lipid A deacylase LpxR family protein [Marinimicrobium sp. ARAG 43.8]|uniref:lipid A deacylase LpxR family protein n=1 Tax=Marinimicrobium sp. ARAG 43.8 TaxID=3418719 RepID=UPI003CEFC426